VNAGEKTYRFFQHYSGSGVPQFQEMMFQPPLAACYTPEGIWKQSATSEQHDGHPLTFLVKAFQPVFAFRRITTLPAQVPYVGIGGRVGAASPSLARRLSPLSTGFPTPVRATNRRRLFNPLITA
jgi:hypothetical protein